MNYMQPGSSNRGGSSIWEGTVRDKDGNLKQRTVPHANLRVESGTDWQGLAMCGTSSSANIFATATGTATATAGAANSGSLTNSGASFPTTATVSGATGGLAGQIVAAATTAGSTVYGVILNNTATVLNVDRWVTAANPFAQATTPDATAKYSVIQCMAPGWYMGLSNTVQSGAATDRVLAGEITSGGFSRTQAVTITHTVAAATYSLAKTLTASATFTINSEAVFTALSATAGVGAASTSGIMLFESAEPNAPTLVSGDTLAQTVTVNY